MTQWLTDWGQPGPETVHDHSNADSGGMDMGNSTMPGMMSQAEMDNGQCQSAIDLAKSIIASQNAEIDQMQGLLGND